MMMKEIKKLIFERDAVLRLDSKTKKDDERIDILSDKVWLALKDNQDNLPVEFIIESLTSLGAAPSILYDDNAHFTIGGNGSQNMPTFEDDFETKETVFDGQWIVKPGHWKKTIREAIRCYFDDNE